MKIIFNWFPPPFFSCSKKNLIRPVFVIKSVALFQSLIAYTFNWKRKGTVTISKTSITSYRTLHGNSGKRPSSSDNHLSGGHYLDSYILKTLKLGLYFDCWCPYQWIKLISSHSRPIPLLYWCLSSPGMTLEFSTWCLVPKRHKLLSKSYVLAKHRQEPVASQETATMVGWWLKCSFLLRCGTVFRLLLFSLVNACSAVFLRPGKCVVDCLVTVCLSEQKPSLNIALSKRKVMKLNEYCFSNYSECSWTCEGSTFLILVT